MKRIFFILLFSLCAIATIDAQFKINDVLIRDGFNVDTATSISIKCVGLDVQIESKQQRPTFYLAFVSKLGKIISDQNINYDNMVIACSKNNIPESQYETVINNVFSSVLSGTRTQKLSSIRLLLTGYSIVLKPDLEQ
jgi:hypothetical protein